MKNNNYEVTNNKINHIDQQILRFWDETKNTNGFILGMRGTIFLTIVIKNGRGSVKPLIR